VAMEVNLLAEDFLALTLKVEGESSMSALHAITNSREPPVLDVVLR